MRLPKLTADKSLDSPSGWFPGKAACVDPRGVGIVSDVQCLLLNGMNVLYCRNCSCARGECFAARR